MRSPLVLCDKLGLTPTESQYEILKAFEALPKVMDRASDPTYQAERAFALAAMWRVLTIPGARCVVLSPNRELSGHFMSFLEAVTKRINTELASISKHPRWDVIQFGSQMGWEIRVLPNLPAMAEDLGPSAVVSVVLGARNEDSKFVECVKALEKHSTHPKNTLVRVW